MRNIIYKFDRLVRSVSKMYLNKIMILMCDGDRRVVMLHKIIKST